MAKRDRFFQLKIIDIFASTIAPCPYLLLSPKAFAQLRAEFARRQMDDAPLRFREGGLARLKASSEERLYMLREKSKGADDKEILTGLVAKGLHPPV